MKKAFGAPEDDDLDESLQFMGIQLNKEDCENWRHAVFLKAHSRNTKDIHTVSVNIRCQYRRDTGKIWSLRVMDTWRVYPVVLCGIDNHVPFGDHKKAFGNPSRTKEESIGLMSYWWVKDDLGVHMRVYSRDSQDVGVNHYAGELQWLYVCSIGLAPAGVGSWLGIG
jgi:hypothetical protein